MRGSKDMGDTSLFQNILFTSANLLRSTTKNESVVIKTVFYKIISGARGRLGGHDG